MARSALLDVTQLEAREVPSAAMFADIRAGVWGSYPISLTPSGGALFFAADNGHGYELYRTDGTPGSAKMVKDIKPGVGGSTPQNMRAADNGVVYFTADDGVNGRALWRSDGTPAGTKKVPGVPSGAMLDPNAFGGSRAQIGLNGKLYFIAQDTPNHPSPRYELWATDGTTTTKLKDFGSANARFVHTLAVADGQVAVTRYRYDGWAFESVWATDGTSGGTTKQQAAVFGTVPGAGQPFRLEPGVQLRPGVFVHASYSTSDNKSAFWVSDGVNPSSVKVLASVLDYGATAREPLPLVKHGGRVYFAVRGDNPEVAGLWETDGTPGATRRMDLLTGTASPQVTDLRAFGGRLLVTSYDATAGRYRLYLSDGSAPGTNEIVLPEAPIDRWGIVGEFPPSAYHPNGTLLLKLGTAGRLYLTDGSIGGWADMTGIPTGFSPTNAYSAYYYQTDAAGRAVAAAWPYTEVFFDGSIYMSAAKGEQRAELWKWNPFPAPVVGTPPVVVGTSVNDGAAQRSVVTSLIVSFDRAVNIEDGALQLKDAKGKTYLLYVEDPVQGQPMLNINFGGKSLPDGRYTFTVKAGRVTDAETGAALAADYTVTFTRLFGDLNGDGVYDREARTMVRAALGARVGDDPRYAAHLDVNLDGVIDATDELAAVRNWGKSV